MTPTDPKGKEMRFCIAVAEMCRSILYRHDFLSDTENEKAHHRIRKFQDKHKVEITQAQLFSAGITYNDNANDSD